MIVISDTTPLNYLILIERIEILRQLYEDVVIPQAVLDEMISSDSPLAVREWAINRPNWTTVQQVSAVPSTQVEGIEEGERQAILLAEELGADLVLLDDLRARQVAQARGLKIVGTLGLLADAARRGLIDLREAIDDLKKTNFRMSVDLLDSILEDMS
jgi:predicted nucleic acid-binding protein